ncbi:MAG: class I SAM-dependent methyltransferase [Alphaproteobacteria bacterium]|nr:class I SAM-dependent methyltransferase [Alphaproteobacteria bacterium]MBV8409053.1 class I SAM-dependent methyltransferase [Alphaproteobacteria bacterium]
MTIDFHAEANRSTYTGRRADPGWAEAMRGIVEPSAKSVADIGCGGGIYSRAWRALGAASVVGVDFSAAMVDAAREQAVGDAQLSFGQGDAAATGLPSTSADIVFARALVHHLSDYGPPLRASRSGRDDE